MSTKRQPSGGWWGPGLSPHERWPGVTIEIPATWSTRTKRWESACGRYYFDAAEADRAQELFETELRHSDGEFAGQLFVLDDWQRDLVVRPLFGWKSKHDDTRRFRKARLYIAKKNGKTALGGGVGIFALYCDGEPGATVICNAADRAQAKIMFTACKRMVEDSPTLSSMSAV
jgi:phage terminase large subunit-like protein